MIKDQCSILKAQCKVLKPLPSELLAARHRARDLVSGLPHEEAIDGGEDGAFHGVKPVQLSLISRKIYGKQLRLPEAWK